MTARKNKRWYPNLGWTMYISHNNDMSTLNASSSFLHWHKFRKITYNGFSTQDSRYLYKKVGINLKLYGEGCISGEGGEVARILRKFINQTFFFNSFRPWITQTPIFNVLPATCYVGGGCYRVNNLYKNYIWSLYYFQRTQIQCCKWKQIFCFPALKITIQNSPYRKVCVLFGQSSVAGLHVCARPCVHGLRKEVELCAM